MSDSREPASKGTSGQLVFVLAAVAVLGIVALAYAPARHGAFLWDDHILAEADGPFRHVPLAKLLTQPFWPENALGDARAPYYRPLVLASFRFDAALGGLPEDFHFTNLALHLVGCCLLTFVARRLGARRGAAILAALLWGLAPRLTESVAWIAGRTDVLAGVLGLGALAISPDVGERRHRGVGLRSAAAGFLLFGALLAKEVALAFAVVLALTAFRRSIARTAAYVGLPVAGWLVLRTLALATRKGPEQTLGTVRRAGTVLEAIGRYAEMTVDAIHPQTSIGMVGELDGVRVAIGVLVLVAAVALLVRFRRELPQGARVGLALAAVGLAPVLHVFPIALAGSVTADRMLYVPLIGLALAGSSLASVARPRARMAAAAGATAVAALFFFATQRRARDYANETLFWVTAAEHAHPRNVSARNGLANVVQKAGAIDLACRLFERSDAALARSSFAWLPPHKRTLESIVNCWARIGRYENAVRLAEDLARRYPTSGRVQMELGFARLHVRDFDGATKAFERSVVLDKTLDRIAGPILASMGETRATAATLAGSSPSAAPLERLAIARHLAALGRATDAEAAHLAIALDGTLPESTRQRGIDFLVFDGSFAAAEKAVVLTPTGIRRNALLILMAQRRAKVVEVEALRGRVEALTTP